MPTPYKPYDLDVLRAELSRDEGREARPYQDTEGILTVGVGHNLEHQDLPDSVIDTLLDLDIEVAEQALDALWPAWRLLDTDRQRVLLNMAFNLGQTRLGGFTRMWEALRNGDLDGAADEMVDSRWYRQVGPRAERLVARMRP